MARTGAGAANVIPPSATAAFGVRLVPGMSTGRVREVVLAHLRGQGWHVVESEPDSVTRLAHPRIVRADFGSGGYPAQRTPLDAPVVQALVRALEPALDQPLLLVPTSGGSLPLYHFTEVLGVPLISLPTVNHDNNQHGANENLRLADFRQAIELFGVLFAQFR
jgi:acetylornithine deacetylase/succinyl-diaminopimelate desuccinylase-like protein